MNRHFIAFSNSRCCFVAVSLLLLYFGSHFCCFVSVSISAVVCAPYYICLFLEQPFAVANGGAAAVRFALLPLPSGLHCCRCRQVCIAAAAVRFALLPLPSGLHCCRCRQVCIA
ncbi:hypothetical protein, partial [Methanimicrococcus hacksteinii]|uniref:hypothetical protein n=1 Tax=Methanimicrococcus hacksteinii TaxID=3028293 RepID=UPI00298F30E2